MKSDSATNIKNNFSAYLDRVKRGEAVLILEHGRPVAQISKPVELGDEQLALAGLVREGLASRPEKGKLDPEEFLRARVTAPAGASLLSALMADREDSR